MTASVDVLIVGAGPVGTLLAAELGARGIRTLVIERNPVTRDEPRAGTLHARTVQSLSRRGYLQVSAEHDPEMFVTDMFHFAGMSGLRISAPANEGPPIVGQAQADLERMFERRARGLDVEIRRGYEVQRVEQTQHQATAFVTSAQSAYRIDAQFLVGADGARSVVRETAGFDSDIQPATIAALLGKVRLLAPRQAPRGWHRTERGWLMINNNPHAHSRIITFDFSGDHIDRHAPLTLDELHAQASRIAGHDIPMADAGFLSRFSNFSRLVRRYRVGRVLLAGDAAHVHFPVGGQGLNLGMQDAINLGWKLALAVSQQHDMLDTYDIERRPAARRVIDNTRAQAALMNPSAEIDPLRELFLELMQLDSVSTLLGNMISGQEVRYPRAGGSEHAGEFLSNVALRTSQGAQSVAELLESGLPVLILLDGDHDALARAAAPWAERMTIVRASCEHHLPWCAALVRPDGYLAWEDSAGATDMEGLRDALIRWLGHAG